LRDIHQMGLHRGAIGFHDVLHVRRISHAGQYPDNGNSNHQFDEGKTYLVPDIGQRFSVFPDNMHNDSPNRD
jgi:hypothetical protein